MKSTIYSGDDEDIQSLIDNAHNFGGGLIELGASEFTINNTITMYPDVRLVGQGRSTSLKMADGANTDMFSVVNGNVYDVANDISHMQLHGNRANNTSGSGVVVYPFSLRFHLHDLHIREFSDNGVRYVNDTTTSDGIWEPIITQSQIEDCDGDGVVLEDNCPDLFLANSSATQCERGFVLSSGGHSLVHAHATTNRDDGFLFKNCNRSWAYDAYGDTNDGHGIHITDSTNLIFVGGRAMKSGTTATPKDGVRLENSYTNKFIGMSMDDPQSTKTQRYGVNEGTTASGNYFALCNMLGNKTGGFNGSKSTRHIENEGHSIKSSGVFSGSGDGTTKKFDAGTLDFDTMPADPADVISTAVGASYSGDDPSPVGTSIGYDANGDVNKIFIHYEPAPASGVTLRARWEAELR